MTTFYQPTANQDSGKDNSLGLSALNHQSVDITTLPTQVQRLITKDRKTLVIINADERVAHSRVAAIMDRVRQI